MFLFNPLLLLSLRTDVVLQTVTLVQLHHNVQALSFDERVKVLDDVWVFEVLAHLGVSATFDCHLVIVIRLIEVLSHQRLSIFIIDLWDGDFLQGILILALV